MAKSQVAKRYAKALLDIGTERGTHDLLRTQLVALASVYASNGEFRHTMLNPSIKIEERKEIMRTISKKYDFDEVARNFFLLLLDKGRFDQVNAIAKEYGKLVDAKNGLVRAYVTSAAELDEAQLALLQGKLAKLTGKEVEVALDVDASLLGGVVTRVGGVVLDGSVRAQFECLRSSILDEI